MTISVAAVYPSPWISPDDIARPTTVIVTAVTVEEFRLPDGSKQHKIVLAFKGARKRLPLNKTQAKALAGLLGDNAEAWAGRTIILAPAVAPNRKATIAVGTPKCEPVGAEAPAPGDTAPAAGPVQPAEGVTSGGDDVCEICGQPGGAHDPNCPDA